MAIGKLGIAFAVVCWLAITCGTVSGDLDISQSARLERRFNSESHGTDFKIQQRRINNENRLQRISLPDGNPRYGPPGRSLLKTRQEQPDATSRSYNEKSDSCQVSREVDRRAEKWSTGSNENYRRQSLTREKDFNSAATRRDSMEREVSKSSSQDSQKPRLNRPRQAKPQNNKLHDEHHILHTPAEGAKEGRRSSERGQYQQTLEKGRRQGERQEYINERTLLKSRRGQTSEERRHTSRGVQRNVVRDDRRNNDGQAHKERVRGNLQTDDRRIFKRDIGDIKNSNRISRQDRISSRSERRSHEHQEIQRREIRLEAREVQKMDNQKQKESFQRKKDVRETSAARQPREDIWERSAARQRTEDIRERSAARQRTEDIRERSAARQRTEDIRERSAARQRTEDIRERSVARQRTEDIRERSVARQRTEDIRERSAARQRTEDIRERSAARQRTEDIRERSTAGQRREDIRERSTAGQRREDNRKRSVSRQRIDDVRERSVSSQRREDVRQTLVAHQRREDVKETLVARQQRENVRERSLGRQRADDVRERSANRQRAGEARERFVNRQRADDTRERSVNRQRADDTRERSINRQRVEDIRERPVSRQQRDESQERSLERRHSEDIRESLLVRQRRDAFEKRSLTRQVEAVRENTLAHRRNEDIRKSTLVDRRSQDIRALNARAIQRKQGYRISDIEKRRREAHNDFSRTRMLEYSEDDLERRRVDLRTATRLENRREVSNEMRRRTANDDTLSQVHDLKERRVTRGAQERIDAKRNRRMREDSQVRDVSERKENKRREILKVRGIQRQEIRTENQNIAGFHRTARTTTRTIEDRRHLSTNYQGARHQEIASEGDNRLILKHRDIMPKAKEESNYKLAKTTTESLEGPYIQNLLTNMEDENLFEMLMPETIKSSVWNAWDANTAITGILGIALYLTRPGKAVY